MECTPCAHCTGTRSRPRVARTRTGVSRPDRAATRSVESMGAESSLCRLHGKRPYARQPPEDRSTPPCTAPHPPATMLPEAEWCTITRDIAAKDGAYAHLGHQL